MKTFVTKAMTPAFVWLLCSSVFATSDVPTETIGVATKIRSDAAIVTPSSAAWNPDSYPGNWGSLWTGVGNAGFTAEFVMMPTDTQYDLLAQIKTGPDNATSESVTVNFKSNGAYFISPDKRIVKTDLTNAPSGKVVYTVDTTGPSWPDAAFVYLGRFEAATGGKLSVLIDAGASQGNYNVNTPVTVWFAPIQPNYGTLSYNDYNSVPAGWFSPDGTEFNHYWANATNNVDVFRTAQYFGFPPADRSAHPTGKYTFTFNHFTIWHPQVATIPLLIYFKPGGAYTPPVVSGYVTAVDTTDAAKGQVTVTIDWPRSTASGPPYPRNDVPVGTYELDTAVMYGAILMSFPTAETGEAYGPKAVTLTYDSSSVADWAIY
ncbi:MAG: hypothetical protein WCK47_07570 [bacterium]|nr:hypothetical protein [Candidatus Sumerlaeota bacterium]